MWHDSPPQDALEAVEDIREYDVPFHMRWAIDSGVRCGWWYTVRATVRVYVIIRGLIWIRIFHPKAAWVCRCTVRQSDTLMRLRVGHRL